MHNIIIFVFVLVTYFIQWPVNITNTPNIFLVTSQKKNKQTYYGSCLQNKLIFIVESSFMRRKKYSKKTLIAIVVEYITHVDM